VLGRVPVGGHVAAANVTAGEADAQMDPGISQFQALLTAVGSSGFHVVDHVQMTAGWAHEGLLASARGRAVLAGRAQTVDAIGSADGRSARSAWMDCTTAETSPT